MQPSWASSHRGPQGHLKNMPHLMFSPQYRHTLPSTIGRTYMFRQVSTGDGFLSMNCASPLGHRRAGAFTLHQSRDLMLCLPCATNERRCDVCEIKSVPINSNWRWHGDLGEVCVWMYDRSSTTEGVDDGRLEMFASSCHQTGIIRSQHYSSQT